MNRQRLFYLFLVALIIVLSMITRLFYLQVIKHDFFKQKSSGQLKKVIHIQPHRGHIFDRHGAVLAMSREAYSIYATPQAVRNIEKTALTLAKILNENPIEIQKKLASKQNFVWIKRRVLPDLKEAIDQAKLSGINAIQEEKREYPRGQLAADMIGFVGLDGGLAGLEYQFDSRLKGSPAKIIIEGDPSGFRLISSKANILGRPKGFKFGSRHVEPASFDGDHVYTTIDSFIQYSAESHLAKQIEEMEAISGQVIVMNPQTGEVLAMADFPTFNPQFFFESTQSILKNSCIVDVFEPGSIFKLVTMSAAIEERIVEPDSMVTIPETLQLANRTIRESHPRSEDEKDRDDKPASEILVHSLNVGTTLLAQSIGDKKFYSYIKRFGFGQRYGVQLPGESNGILRHVDRWSAVDIGMMSFGQGVGVTPLQMVSAGSVIANGGYLIKPRIIHSVSDYEGVTVKANQKQVLRRVVKEATAFKVKQMLEAAVFEGTGQRAKIPGYRIMGKTGTAQVAGPGGVGYLKGEYIASFLGFFPFDQPKYVILVSIHSPKKYISGGMVSAPVFKRIAQDIIHYYNIPPDATESNET